jgi:deoxyribodipyrimidine photo-lyase
MGQNALALVWHRRDLRLHDNAALSAATRQFERVLGLFVLDPDILQRPDTAPGRVQFMLDALAELQGKYTQLGGRLVLRRGQPLTVLCQLVNESGAIAVFWNDDVEPYAIARDTAVRQGLTAEGIAVQSFQDMLLHGPGQVLTQGSACYSVFTPFWRNWSAQAKQAPWPAPPALASPDIATLPLPTLADLGFHCPQELPLAGEDAALEQLEQFCWSGDIFAYEERRNLPFEPGTSQLSPHLRWGTIGIRQVWQATVDAESEVRSDEAEASLRTWRQELCWREFYKHALAAWPQLETTAFRAQFEAFSWDDNRDRFDAWCRGETGYPIVDAAMRQLNQTGWMHNRCRMIVASFLTKDLLIDWRWGERYFMQQLVDGDLAANNGGWQWSASVGTDPKPLRIFNPSTQASKYDPEGEYIRRYVPEIAGCDAAYVFDMSPIAIRDRQDCGYPAPIVDHKQQQQEFKRRYNACK